MTRLTSNAREGGCLRARGTRAFRPSSSFPSSLTRACISRRNPTLYRVQRRYGLRPKKLASTRTHVTRASTIHRATQPNQIWSWDITWLPTNIRGAYFYLYLVMDVWSRPIVGWCIAERESAEVAATLVRQACADGSVGPRCLVLHSDNGAPMRGSAMISRLQWLGIVPSFSCPRVSDDNPYSEALFRTLKHTPAYPRLPFC
jgi:putative transposase